MSMKPFTLSTVLEAVGRIQATKPYLEDRSVYRQNGPLFQNSNFPSLVG